MYATASATRIKAARRLTKRAFRERERSFLAEGPQAVSEALATGARISGLFVTAPAQARHADLVDVAEDAGVEVQLVSGEVMGELAQTITPQGLLAVCDFVDVPLDRLTAGRTVLRTADAAGADAVIFADASVDLYNGKCVRASAGSLFHLPVVAGGRLPETITTLKKAGLRVFAADGRARRRHPGRSGHPRVPVGPDRVAVRQRGVGTPRRPAGTRGRVGRGPDLRPRGVAQPRLRRGGVPVRVGVRAAGHVRLTHPAARRGNTSRAIMITTRCTPLSRPANPRGIGYLRYNVAKSRSGA